MQNTMLRRVEVEEICGLTRSTIYRLMRAGKFPEPIRIGPRAVRWPKQELYDWISTRPRADGEADEANDKAGRRKKKRKSATS